ncbi:hypothetical protein O181_032824 [Austropuccinia psidii MF-1]|uniref:Uncharacterized protein n=1 Tax=Austropuccinia psidii MF-1 TaxID=1389203 RepID=A0A9Q3CXJ3_9BASI|nr:hypothetical protein [Austropuccinia psidii MF-1]
MNFDVNSEPELIEGNDLRAEPLLSASYRDISVPIQKLVQRIKRRAVGNMPKPLAGGHELLLTHQELSGSGEDHRTLRRVEPITLQRQIQKIKNWFKNQSLLSVDQKKELEMTPTLEEGPAASTSSKPAPEAQRTSKKEERSQEL